MKSFLFQIRVHCRNLNGSMAEFYYLLRTEGHLTLFWKWKENQNKLFLVAHSETAAKSL